VISPLVGIALVAWLRPDPLTGKVLVLEAAMPAAVNTMLLAVEFGAEPEQVSGVTLVTTVLSLVSVSFWVWFL
jgi:predicted permease